MNDHVQEFRERARAWLEAHATQRVKRSLPPESGVSDAVGNDIEGARARQRSLAEAGLAGIMWPEQYGGAGLGVDERLAFDSEAAQFSTGLAVFDVAMNLVGPTLLAHGTEEQKRSHLPAILRGDEIWCQLFSEPGAGSDLASLSTRADLRNDGWHVNGQKVWTSGAVHSAFAILIARTDFEAPKHRGLTYFVVDMAAPGVTVRPLRQMTGDSHFAEVFLDDVVLPLESVVGEIGDGWSVVRTTLSNERVSIGGEPGVEAAQLIGLAREGHHGSVEMDSALVDAIADLHVRNRVLKALEHRTTANTAAGAQPGPEASIFKLEYAALQKIGNDLALRILGPAGLLQGSDAPLDGAWQRNLLTSPYLRIAGGTDEIQRNVIAERILGLPADKDDNRRQPFNQLVRG